MLVALALLCGLLLQPAAEVLAVARIATVPSPCELAEGLDRIWISSYGNNAVVGIDPSTNEGTTTLDVPDGPCGVTVGFGSVWVSGGTQTVARIDPESGETIATIEIPGEIYDVQAGPDAIWASDASSGGAPSRGFTFHRRSSVTGWTLPKRTWSINTARPSVSRICTSASRATGSPGA